MLAGEAFFVNPMQCHFVIRSFKWHGDHAVVEEEDENKTTIVTGGQTHSWDELEMIREVWSLVHGQSMLRLTVILESRDTVDGQVVPTS